MLMNSPERIQAEEVGVIRGNDSTQVMLGQCAKVGSHNGPKCLTSCGGTLRGNRNRGSDGATDAILRSQPPPDPSGLGVGMLSHSVASLCDLGYFYDAARPKTTAHIWTGRDTACRMLSTGGIKMRRRKVHPTPGGKEICQMCRNVAKRFPTQSVLSQNVGSETSGEEYA